MSALIRAAFKPYTLSSLRSGMHIAMHLRLARLGPPRLRSFLFAYLGFPFCLGMTLPFSPRSIPALASAFTTAMLTVTSGPGSMLPSGTTISVGG
jgi:hypothetical protein